MKQLLVNLTKNSYNIYIDSGLFNDSKLFFNTIFGSQSIDADLISHKKILVVSDQNVANLYVNKILQQLMLLGLYVETFIIPSGEQYKNLQTFEQINTFLLEHNYNRDVTILALGGGVVGDISGFVAACYQRGVDFIQIPTTLLAQVDSSVGGKTAINHILGKNMIGAFYQPKAVLIDTKCLNSLPKRELSSGIAEIIKYSIIFDAQFFIWLENNMHLLLQLDPQVTQYAIARCCAIKTMIVCQDEKEQNIRALLNLGHTFGHAIEAHQGYGNWLHGEAVAVGMIIATKIAKQLALLTNEQVARITRLIKRANLPIHSPNMSIDDFMKHIIRDKKVLSGSVRLILPTDIGKADIFTNTPLTLIQQAIEG